jgi:hypothetical protein
MEHRWLSTGHPRRAGAGGAQPVPGLAPRAEVPAIYMLPQSVPKGLRPTALPVPALPIFADRDPLTPVPERSR